MSLVDAALRRLGRTVRPTPVRPVVTVLNGTVKTVTAAASADTPPVAAVVVTVAGNDVPAPYLASYTPQAPGSYTPTTGDMVLVLFNGSSPIILGRVTGLPVF